MKKNVQNGKLVVGKQEYTQNLIWKINVGNLANVFEVEILKGCEVLYYAPAVGSMIFDEGLHTIDKQKYIVRDRGDLYGIDTTPFEIVCGVYGVPYNDYSYGKDTKVGLYAKCKVSINNAKVLYKKLIDSLSETLSIENVKETVSEKLKDCLKLWLTSAIKNARHSEVDIKCLENIKSLEEDFNKILIDWGLVIQSGSLSVGQVKFDEAYIKDKEDKEKLEEQNKIDEENRLREERQRRRDIDLINSLQSNAKDKEHENEITAFCPKCKKAYDRANNFCPHCGTTLKK